ncbi:helix-turn-helix transcriptional regulator [Mucilaginibacter sp. PAMB04168]|uniref:helix-turn-helix domain-containing protein n=1 Tax=Mucilaginibacter sp. PAMB04168 TaxID=3138567 RepID=UPI0031F6E3B2
MEEAIFNKKPLSIGQKVERIRTFRGYKQEYLASKLGVSQQTVSKIEQQEEIEDDLLKQIAEALGVTPEVIKNFDEDKITYIINHQYNIYNNEIKDNATNNFVFNPIEKIAELYERLLKTEREKNELLKK